MFGSLFFEIVEAFVQDIVDSAELSSLVPFLVLVLLEDALSFHVFLVADLERLVLNQAVGVLGFCYFVVHVAFVH